MVTGLEKFKNRLDPAKELYAGEIKSFTEKYESLGEMSIREIPDIDTQNHVFSFEKVNGTSQKELDEIYLEIFNHMEEFSKANGIEKFCQNVYMILQNTLNFNYICGHYIF